MTGAEIEQLQTLQGADNSVDGLRDQCGVITRFLAGREVTDTDGGWVKVDEDETLPDDWVWRTMPTDQIATLAEQLMAVFKQQWDGVGNREQRRKKAKA